MHITYQAALLRFSSLVPDGTASMYKAATEISIVCEDLDRQGLLGSLWNFGIHEIDLAMVMHARQANSKDPATAKTGMRNLQRGLPRTRELGSRSSFAQQAQIFYEDLVKKMNERANSEDKADRGYGVTTEHGDGVMAAENCVDAPVQSSAGSTTGNADWIPEMYFTDSLFQVQMMAHDGNAWGCDMYYDQAQVQYPQQFPPS